jgi:hypothetical protein
MKLELVKIKPCMPISLFVVVTVAIVVLLLDNANLDNAAYGQSLLFPNAQNSSLSSNPSPILHYQQQPSLANQQNQSNLHLVRITIPTKGQQVPVGKELFILGTSAGNASSGCKVSVKVNSINPYHEASPNSGSGRSDYSKWNFTLSPTYTAIKQGQNKITAKFACDNETALVSHYSVNVTGVSTVSTTFSPNHQYLQPAVNSKAPTTTATTSTTATAAIHVSPSKPSPVNTNHQVSLVSLSIRIGKSSVHPGDTEIVSISAVDKNSSKPITGASVSGNISSSGLLKKFRGSTDNSGRASYSWKVSSGDTTGKYRVIAQVYSPDYESKSASKTFKVSPIPVIVSSPTYTNNNSLTSSSHVTNNDNNNNNNTSSAAHINNSKNKNRHQHTSTINPVNNGNNNNSLTPSPHTPGSNTKKSNLATSNAAKISNTKNKNLHNPFSFINPNQRFGVPITHVPFVIP